MIDIDRTLRKIASNLWFEWNADVHLLFRSVSPYVWGLFRRNLYRFLKLQAENPFLYKRRLAELLTDSRFLALFEKVEKDFSTYVQGKDTWLDRNYPALAGSTVAYFSMEYGIDILRIYSGGLGILSGDHLRGASDLGIKMTGVGLFYLHGYYEQAVEQDGNMRVLYDSIYPPNKAVRDFLPLDPVKVSGKNEDLIIEIPMRDRKVKARVWRVRMGRNDLFLLDSNLRENHVHDRHITRRLYASQKQREAERMRRLEQELLLGIGGIRALRAGGVEPAVYHLNEGHVSFAALEILRELIEKHGLGFDEARKIAAQKIGFTTHTPVPEGNEQFEEGLARSYLVPYLDSFLKPGEREVIFNCARNREDRFDMTKLALLLSGVYRNGVSALHGEVCRRMWGYAWGNHDPEGRGIEIGHITNAVHVPYWQKPILRRSIEEKGGLGNVGAIPDETIWKFHMEFRTKLIEKVRERVAYQLLREEVEWQTIHVRTRSLLDPDGFFIGFARRFAEYKRVTMLLEEEERLFQFLESAWRKYGKPVHILFAGKPHPDNYAGRDKIRYIITVSSKLAQRAKERGFKAEVLFIEGYDIDLARYLVAGVDIWLNNPIRPLEASGTSGMKAGMNGVLNVSIPDGWVPEGIVNGKNGWIFGKGDWNSAAADRAELFKLLEETVLPLYFERQNSGDTFSRSWVAMMKESIRSLTEKFNTERMLREYVEKMYLPAVRAELEMKEKVKG